MASVSSDNKIKIWELKQGRLGWTVFGHEGEIKTIQFNEKGDYFATGGDDKLVMIWQLSRYPGGVYKYDSCDYMKCFHFICFSSKTQIKAITLYVY